MQVVAFDETKRREVQTKEYLSIVNTYYGTILEMFEGPQVFLVNMLRKERSMSRYPEHAAWVQKTGFLFPSLLTLVKKLPYAFKLPVK